MTFKWTQEVEDEIFGRMLKGEGVVTILGPDRDDFLPSEATFYRKLQSGDAAFCEKYARAREAQAHREAEEIKEIADLATPENVHVARLRMDARKWRAGKLAPKVYGDKIEVNGPGEGGAHIHKVEMTFVRPGSETANR